MTVFTNFSGKKILAPGVALVACVSLALVYCTGRTMGTEVGISLSGAMRGCLLLLVVSIPVVILARIFFVGKHFPRFIAAFLLLLCFAVCGGELYLVQDELNFCRACHRFQRTSEYLSRPRACPFVNSQLIYKEGTDVYALD